MALFRKKDKQETQTEKEEGFFTGLVKTPFRLGKQNYEATGANRTLGTLSKYTEDLMKDMKSFNSAGKTEEERTRIYHLDEIAEKYGITNMAVFEERYHDLVNSFYVTLVLSVIFGSTTVYFFSDGRYSATLSSFAMFLCMLSVMFFLSVNAYRLKVGKTVEVSKWVKAKAFFPTHKIALATYEERETLKKERMTARIQRIEKSPLLKRLVLKGWFALTQRQSVASVKAKLGGWNSFAKHKNR